jgi:DNA mismatch repair protein MutL
MTVQEQPRIRLLSEDVVRKIAAGEVVERPASIVKELVENAVDSGASRIVVEIETSGGFISSISVTDNGCGIPEGDLVLAVMPHATSKIRDDRDLLAIHTLGFRGEALSSIGEVATLTITSRPQDGDYGASITVRDGICSGVEPAASPVGTRVVVTGIFASVPARKKFQKSISTELGRVTGVVEQAALAHPGTGFFLIINRRERIAIAPGGDLASVISGLFGATPSTGFVAVSSKGAGISVEGLLGLPELARQDPFRFFLMVNGRPVRAPRIAQAAKEAYGTLLPHGAWPAGCIHLIMDPAAVDVNVHPAKMVVRFSEENEVAEMVRSAAAETLLRANLVPGPAPEPDRIMTVVADPPLGYGNRPAVRWEVREPGTALLKDTEMRLRQTVPDSHDGPGGDVPKVVAQVNALYLVASDTRGALWLIDQHAAHERVLYEQTLWGDPGDVQELIVPVPLNISPSETTALQDAMPELELSGFVIEPFGHGKYVVRAVPAVLGRVGDSREVQEIIAAILEGGFRSRVPFRERVAEVIACRGAIKAGAPCTIEQGNRLIEQLYHCRLPWTCPHGRPTMVRFTPHDLEKMFKRA